MSNSNLEVSKVNRANEMSELNNLMVEPSSLERSAKHVTKFRLDEINKIKDYLNSEIKERKAMKSFQKLFMKRIIMNKLETILKV